jgi:acyl-CoA reductase-like NAD-dependent aldehyde dehydrogenase
LELGSNSVSIVAADADLRLVTDLVGRAGYRKSGQVCTSVQRILADRSVFDELGELLAAKVASLTAGDPRSPNSDIGPLISPDAAARACAWIEEARDAGTTVVGGDLDGAVLQPTLVISPNDDSPLVTEEAFAPVVSLIPVDSTNAAIEVTNSGRYGLQVGFFTQDLDRAFDAVRRLEAGGVIINDTSSYHADLMPYGGVKESGHGVEGPKYAVQNMTDPRLVVMNLRAPGGG